MAQRADIQGIGGQRPARQLSEGQKARLQKAVREFESVFVGYMLKSMRSESGNTGMLGEGFGGDIMGSMFDAELAKHISRNSQLGIAEMFYRQATGEPLPPGGKPSPVSPVKQVLPAAVPEEDESPVPCSAVSAPKIGVESPKPAPLPQEVSRIGTAVAKRVNAYAPIVREVSERLGMDENLLKAVIASESAGNPKARSRRDAKGLMQLIDSTAQDMGVKNVWNPRENIMGGAKYLQQLLDRFGGNVQHAVASYNAGPGAVEKHNGIPPFHETREYVRRVMEYFQFFGQQEALGDDTDK